MTNMTRIAGALQVELDVSGNLSLMVIEDMFKRAIAAAVGLPDEFVAKVEVSEINRSVQDNVSMPETNDTLQKNSSSGTRRLQAIQTKWFEVYYEVDVPSNMDADTIIERADRIAVPGSEESQLFRDILMSTDGVERVGEIISTVSAYEIGATTTAPSKSQDSKEDESSWKAIVIGLSVAFIIVICLGLSAVLIKRKMVMDGTNGEPGADIENGHLKPVNPTSQATTEAVTGAATQDPKPATEVKAPLVDANAAQIVTDDTDGLPVADIKNAKPVNPLSQASTQAVTDTALEDPKQTSVVEAPVDNAHTPSKSQSDQFAHCEDVVLVDIPETKGKISTIKDRRQLKI